MPSMSCNVDSGIIGKLVSFKLNVNKPRPQWLINKETREYTVTRKLPVSSVVVEIELQGVVLDKVNEGYLIKLSFPFRYPHQPDNEIRLLTVTASWLIDVYYNSDFKRPKPLPADLYYMEPDPELVRLEQERAKKEQDRKIAEAKAVALAEVEAEAERLRLESLEKGQIIGDKTFGLISLVKKPDEEEIAEQERQLDEFKAKTVQKHLDMLDGGGAESFPCNITVNPTTPGKTGFHSKLEPIKKLLW